MACYQESWGGVPTVDHECGAKGLTVEKLDAVQASYLQAMTDGSSCTPVVCDVLAAVPDLLDELERMRSKLAGSLGLSSWPIEGVWVVERRSEGSLRRCQIARHLSDLPDPTPVASAELRREAITAVMLKIQEDLKNSLTFERGAVAWRLPSADDMASQVINALVEKQPQTVSGGAGAP